MKVIKNVDDKIESLIDDPTPEIMEMADSYRRLIKVFVGNSIGSSGEEAVELVQIAFKMRQAQPDIELEDHEFTVLKKKVDENALKIPARFHGQLVLKLREAEK
jgi:hypothetical protein